MRPDTMAVYAKAKELGAAKTERRINWTWSHDFPDSETAWRFVAWLDEHGFEHRGVSDRSVRWR